MISVLELYPNTYIYELLMFLAVSGEFPRRKLELFGNDRLIKRMLHRAKQVQDFKLMNGEIRTGQLFSESGRGALKTIRLHKNALSILGELDGAALDCYMKTYNQHFAGDKVMRNHRVSEGLAIMRNADIEYRPYALPELKIDAVGEYSGGPRFYIGRDIKSLEDPGNNKHAYSRIIGAVLSEGGVYAVYNTRIKPMKWLPMGEFKAKIMVESVARWNAGVTTVDSAIMLGDSFENAIKTLNNTNDRKNKRMDSIFYNIHFLPLDGYGARLAKILIQPGWREQINAAVFSGTMLRRKYYDRECDAMDGDKYILSFLDGNLGRLLRFIDAIQYDRGQGIQSQHVVVCYDWQYEPLREFVGDLTEVKALAMEDIEGALETSGN